MQVAARGRLAVAVAIASAIALVPMVTSWTAAAPTLIQFVSDTTWQVTDGDPAVGPDLDLPGLAEPICLNASAPPTCPPDANLYGYPGSAWNADLSSIEGALWIWAPGVTGETPRSDLDVYLFSKTIDVPGTPVAGTISVGVDDAADVLVNGQLAGSVGGFEALSVLDIASLLTTGANEIVVRAHNGLICNADCPYQTNPAGVVFGGSITYESSTPPPTAAPTPSPTPPPTEPPTPASSATVPPATPTETEGPADPGPASTDVLPFVGAAALLVLGGLLVFFLVRRPRRRDESASS